MERSLLMSKDKKGKRWDGRSRIPTQQYKDNYNEIFKKKKQILKTIVSPLTQLRNLVSALIFKLTRK